MSVNTAVSEYLEKLRGLGWLGAEKINPGIEQYKVKQRFQEISISPPMEAIDFWCLMNGIIDGDFTLDQMQIFPGYYPLSLREAIDAYLDRASDPEIWPDYLFPFLADGIGNFLSFDVRSFQHNKCSVHDQQAGFFPACLYSSIENFFLTAAAAIDKQIIFIEGSYLEISDEKYQELAAKMNPGLDFWMSP